MTGMAFVRKFRDLEEQADQLGFKIGASRHFNREYDVVALTPKDADALPIYSRDAELFVGSIEELERWLQGFDKARQYDTMLFGQRHDRKRKRLEQDYRNEQLLQMIQKSGE